MKKVSTIKFLLIVFMLIVCGEAYSQTVKYHYDALGRLTFVEDSTNGNRDYDYDSAGNRTEVRVGVASDDAPAPVPPPAPTGLSCSLLYVNAWRGTWSPVTGASYYIVRSNSITNDQTQTTSTQHVFSGPGATCKWVQACNQANVCSEKSYF